MILYLKVRMYIVKYMLFNRYVMILYIEGTDTYINVGIVIWMYILLNLYMYIRRLNDMTRIYRWCGGL